MRVLSAFTAVIGGVFAAGSALGQGTGGSLEFPTGTVVAPPVEAPTATAPVSPILILDEDRLFTRSAWGQRVQSDFDAAAAALQAENRKLETELASEERALSDRRATMPAESFRGAAQNFDERVVGIRQAQEAKARALTSRRDAERRAFFSAATPALRELLRSRGAAAIVDARVVLLSLNSLDATEEAITLVDRRLGSGPAGGVPASDPAPPSPDRPATEGPGIDAPAPDQVRDPD